MKVLLVEIQSLNKRKCVNKDLAGGMGTGTWVGNSLGARIFEYTKKKSVILPNITIAYLLAIFRKASWEAELISVKKEIPEVKADLVLVQTSIVDASHELAVVKALKKQGLKVGVFGTFATAVPEYFKEADFVIQGEAEAGALKIIKAGQLPAGVMEAGILEDVNSLPFPDWREFPVEKYSYFPALNKRPVLTMLTSRGCPYSCSYYCPYTVMAGKVWRARSIENVLEEIKYLKEEYSIKAVDFRDAVFSLDRDRILNLAERLSKKDLDIIWSCETRLDRLDKELIKKMRRVGLRHINIGIESFDNEILKQSARLPVAHRHQEEIIAYCHRLGISIAAFYILGLENDTRAGILKTIEYAKKLNTLVAQFTIATPYPGTPYYEKLKKEGRIMADNWEDYDAYTPVFKHKSLSSEELLALKEKAFVSYYFRPAYLFKHGAKIILKKFL